LGSIGRGHGRCDGRPRSIDSQALEADALHFSTDVWSSGVVLVGLALVWLGQRVPGFSALANADAVAALGVAAIVIWVSARWGGRLYRH